MVTPVPDDAIVTPVASREPRMPRTHAPRAREAT